jgi:hypothetical protein
MSHMGYTVLVASITSMPLAERGLLKASIGLTCVLATVVVRARARTSLTALPHTQHAPSNVNV